MVHGTRVQVQLRDGGAIVGEAGGDKGDLSQPKTDGEIADKFLALTEGVLGAQRANRALEALWQLESMADVRTIPRLLVFA